MIAADVYTIAKSLHKEEFIKLSNMLRSDVNKSDVKLKKKNVLPDFKREDGLRYLLENHIRKGKKIIVPFVPKNKYEWYELKQNES
ncbi:hypothetical protein BTO04_05065 [Polaribacter sp. SA4-10]|uniref:hypothetical protein n=1 Tax=Polaribacter sp. SA4-10 TaxID=754397 RepID=UPI000B3BEC4C|nr:hypothetical protein [Polaribacter sp. SA4-10]ARV06111.1 hypothetical protein BTO04_05065 [Polaribacter sp. SA4-10]